MKRAPFREETQAAFAKYGKETPVRWCRSCSRYYRADQFAAHIYAGVGVTVEY